MRYRAGFVRAGKTPFAKSAPLKALSFLLALLLLLLPAAHAQLQVEIGFKRTLYLAYEPLIANVSITNLSGNSLNLRDTDGQHWFGFQIETLDGRPVAPRDSRHTNPPLLLEPGQKLSRAVNLTPLYPISEYGGYRIRAAIHVPSLGRSFTSNPLNVEITEGRSIQKKTVGVPANQPGGGGLREINLLTHRLPSSTQLYLRIVDPDRGVVHCTHRLGRLVSYGTPDFLLDRDNQIHVLQNVAPKSFLYSHIGLDGEVLARKTYQQNLKRPSLVKTPDSRVVVVGATEFDAKAAEEQKQTTPSISDRPHPVPGSETDLTPTEEKRPSNLLSR
jgi:hypothetical protein